MENLSYIFGLIYGSISKKMDVLFDGTIASVISEIAVISKNALVLYVIVWGILMIYGRIQDAATDGIKRIALIAFVIACTQHLPFYSDNIAHHLEGLSAGLIDLLGASTFPAMSPADNADYVSVMTAKGFVISPAAQSLDYALTAFYRALASVLEAADWAEKVLIGLQSLILWIVIFIFLGLAAYLTLISLIVVKSLLMVGPIFFLCLLFDGTRNFFSGWLSLIINYSLVAFLGVIFTLLISRMLIVSLVAMGAGEFDGLGMGNVLAIGFVGIILMFQVQSMAASIAGGLSLNTRIPGLRTRTRPKQEKEENPKKPETPPTNSVENKS